MKREVDSSLVERGVAERVKLTKGYDHKRDELIKQHEYVRLALNQHRTDVSLFGFVINNSLKNIFV